MESLIIMRGLPGSGKSTEAFFLGDLICSTDDFFRDEDGNYLFDATKIVEAHAWNQKRVAELLKTYGGQLVVDNTNVCLWEMRPYVEMAIENGQRVKIVEPKTWWAKDVAECHNRNTHKVPLDVVQAMSKRWEEYTGVEDVLASKAPWE